MSRSSEAVVRCNYLISELININKHENRFAQASKRKTLRAVMGQLTHHLEPVQTPARVVVEFGWPDNVRRDADNYEIKAAIDALVDSGVLPDDNGRHVPETTRRDLGKTHNVRGWVELTVRVETIGGAA